MWPPVTFTGTVSGVTVPFGKAQVYVKRFISQGTIEERIAEVLERKRQLFNDLIAQNGLPPSLGLSEDDIFGLFDIRSRPKRPAAAALAA